MIATRLLFPCLAIIVALVAYTTPGLFAPYRGAVVPLLSVIMFAMGLTLRLADFHSVVQRPSPVVLGAALQFSVMPLAGLLIATALSMPQELVVGLVLLGACPGGTASNVMAYLARADVALSVTMTMISTILAVFLTPLLTWALIGQSVPVDVGGMLLSLVKIVLLPLGVGILANRYLAHVIAPGKRLLPAVAIVAILVIIGIVVALNRDNLATAGAAVFLAILAHNAVGLLSGYWVPRLLGFDRRTCRTLSFEVGMQNSGLGTALALAHFTPLSALPSALFSVWHSVSGALLAGFWRANPPPQPRPAETEAR